MKRLLATLTAALTLAAMVFAVNTVPAYALEDEYDLEYYERFKGQGLTLNVFNWGEYISDGSDDSMDVNAEFEELTGIKVVYSTFESNETLYAKLKTGGASYDVVIPSEYMIARLAEDELLLPLNFDNIPNYHYINSSYHIPGYEQYSVPYTWGAVGLIYNSEMIDDADAITSWSVLWDARYSSNILMFNNSKDAFGIAFKLLGLPINAESMEQIDKGAAKLKEQKPLLQAYVMDEIFDKMTGGEAAIAPYYAGDFYTMQQDNEALRFVYPSEGTNIFVDAMCVPSCAKNQELAEMYINFMLEPEVGCANIEYIGYSTPNDAVYEILPDEMKENEILYPDEETIANMEFFRHTSAELASYMDGKWTEILAFDQEYDKMIMPLFLVACLVATIAVNVMRASRKRRETK